MAIILFILSFTTFKEGNTGKNIREILGFIGGIASLFGILFAINQNIHAKSELETVKEVTNDTKESIKKILNIEQITKNCEKIKLIQELLEELEYKAALHLSEILKETLIEIQEIILPKDSISSYDLLPHIKRLGINIENLKNEIREKANKIKLSNIIRDFSDLKDCMVKIKLTFTKI